MPNKDWTEYRIAILQTLERVDADIAILKKACEDYKIELNNQKWMTRIIIVISSLGGGAASNVLLKMLGLL